MNGERDADDAEGTYNCEPSLVMHSTMSMMAKKFDKIRFF
jgi:hypothetical protein